MTKFLKECFPTKITNDQAKDTGMAMVLLCLILRFFTKVEWFIGLGAVLLVVTMVVPRAYRPVAVVWLGLSRLIGTVVSRVLLTVVFLVIVFPVGIIRRVAGKDPLLLNEFRKGRESVMKTRAHVYTPADIDKPY